VEQNELDQLFIKLNDHYFGGLLSPVPVAVSDPEVNVARDAEDTECNGICRFTVSGDDWTAVISLSPWVMQNDALAAASLLHEMVHLSLGPKQADHGNEWIAACTRINQCEGWTNWDECEDEDWLTWPLSG
jgi:hypothetical protein